MELKVWVDGVQRVVCGVTEVTTCQEVVIALAQAIGESSWTGNVQSNPEIRAVTGHVAAFVLSISEFLMKLNYVPCWTTLLNTGLH